MTTQLAAPEDIYPGPVLLDSLNELVAQNLGANILEIPKACPEQGRRDEPGILELAGPAIIILVCPADSCAERSRSKLGNGGAREQRCG